MAQRIRIVEFFGLPGAGKTTIAKDLVKELKKQGILCVGSWELVGGDHDLVLFRQLKRMRMILISICFLPFPAYRVACMLLSVRQRFFIDNVKLFWNFLVVLGILALGMRQQNKVFVLDQGLFQAFWSLYFNACKPFKLDRVADLTLEINMSNIALVHVAAPDDMIRARLRSRRSTARIQKGGQLEDSETWCRAHFLAEKLLEYMRNPESTNKLGLVLSLNNEGVPSARNVQSVITMMAMEST